ncbi:uncharacterized protein J4E87_009635 [Alternaria ethzedia]|uniref:uncharacterized protein n=1 Tax=Alternaria ethzedia TaxID=181014 RepID=UPI0020C4ABE7|nr:uncharacterized protein J4E87_009635 [Alternaria ethzedia]KAI4614238.1 hypothetical protein J4E87_009635 [Alternaria ethzedia]
MRNRKNTKDTSLRMPPKENRQYDISLRKENELRRRRQQNDGNENNGNAGPVAPTILAASTATVAPARPDANLDTREDSMMVDDEADVAREQEVEQEAEEAVEDGVQKPHREPVPEDEEELLNYLTELDDEVAGPATASDPPPPPVGNAAASAIAPVPAPALTDAQRVRQETNAMARSWGPQFSTLSGCIPANTWLKGQTKDLTEHTCEPDTLKQLRKLSDATPNLGKEVRKKIESRWNTRKSKTGDIGSTPAEKQKSLRDDLERILKEYEKQAEAQGKGKKRSAGDDGKEMSERRKTLRHSAKPNYNDLDPHRLHQDDDDDSGSGSSIILHDGPAPKKADDGGKAAASAKQNGKAAATGTANNATQATVLTESQRGRALSDIYINWNIYQLHLDFPRGLFPANITSDTAIDLRLVARLLDLSNLHDDSRQAFALMERIRAHLMQSFIRARSTDEAIAFLAQFDGPTHAAVPTPGGSTTRLTTAITRGGRRLSAAEMLARQSTIDDDSRGEPLLLTFEERERRRRDRERYPPTAPLLTNQSFRASQDATQPAAQLGLSRFEGGVLTIGSIWTLRRALNDSRQADQRIHSARRRYEQAVLNGQSVQDQAALLLGIEAARRVSDEAYARTDELQGRWVGARSRRSTMGDGLGGLSGNVELGRRAQAEGVGEEGSGEGQQEGGGGESGGGGLGEGRKKTKKPPPPNSSNSQDITNAMPPKTPNLKGAEPPGDTQAEALERRQAIATIIANWGQAFSTMRNWMHVDTWLQGSTERMTEFTCDMTTIRAFRDLSRNTPNRGQEVKDQIEQYYVRRYHNKSAGPIGSTKSEKMGHICQDLQKLLAGAFIDRAKFKANNTKKRPAAGKGPGKKQAARKKTKKNTTTAIPIASNDQDEDDAITSEEEDIVVPESDEAEDDEPLPAPNPKPAAKPANNGAANEFRRRLRSHGKDEAEKEAQQTEREKSNANEAEADDDTSSIFSEAPEAQTIHTTDDKDSALVLIYSNWQIVSLHKDFPAMLRGGDLNAPEDTGIEDVIIELLRDLSERFPTKRQGKKISEELEMRCKRMKRYSLKAVYQAITATARSYRWASVSEDSLGLSADEGDQNEQGPPPEVARPEAVPTASRPDKQRRYAARSDEASFEMQAAWDAVVVAEAAVKVAQAKRARAAFKGESAYQQATRQLRVSEEQLRVAEAYACARSLGRPQRVGETVGPGGDERWQRQSGDGGGVEEGREQNREGGAGEGGDVEEDVREGEGHGESEGNEGEDGSIPTGSRTS